MPRKILIQKVDLDTVGVAYYLGVTREDTVEVVRGNVSPKDLADKDVVCIEVGGSGQMHLNNWDHHHPDGPTKSAIWQIHHYKICSDDKDTPLVRYIDILDRKGPQALAKESGGNVEFPTLSDVFAGMLLTERDPMEQLHKGVEILKQVNGNQNPFSTIQGFKLYAEAKAENNRQIAKAVESAGWTTTKLGRKLGYLETEFFGAPGTLYGRGAKIVVAYNPNFGTPPGIPKFTIAGNGIKVNAVLSELNALEEGWGGPSTGTIIGSPRGGSKLTLDQVVKIVKREL